MLLHDARRRARTDADGQLVTLQQQDRSRWDRGMIAQGLEALAQAREHSTTPGVYQLQAVISAEHATAPSFKQTNWRQIALAYDHLYVQQPTPIVRISGAVALSYAHDAQIGLKALAPLINHPAVADYQSFHAAHADLLRRAGNTQEAVAAYERAAALAQNDAEHTFLEARRDALVQVKKR